MSECVRVGEERKKKEGERRDGNWRCRALYHVDEGGRWAREPPHQGGSGASEAMREIERTMGRDVTGVGECRAGVKVGGGGHRARTQSRRAVDGPRTGCWTTRGCVVWKRRTTTVRINSIRERTSQNRRTREGERRERQRERRWVGWKRGNDRDAEGGVV